MKKSRISDSEGARERYQALEEMLLPIIKPYYEFEGKLDLSEHDPSAQMGSLLARMLNCQIVIHLSMDEQYFGADSVIARKVSVENGNLVRFWGFIYWLGKPNDYEVNVSGKDPFYCEFSLEKERVHLRKMKFGDYNQVNLDRVWLLDAELDWIYDFEKELE